MSDWLWVWIVALAGFVVLELLLPVLFFALSFAVGAGLAALIAALDGPVALQWAAFVVGTGIALLILVPIGRRITHSIPEGDETPEGAARWVGRTAVVLEAIPAGVNATGLVRLERAQWRAETADGDAIPAGEQAEVIAVRGTRLVVAPTEPPREVSKGDVG